MNSQHTIYLFSWNSSWETSGTLTCPSWIKFLENRNTERFSLISYKVLNFKFVYDS